MKITSQNGAEFIADPEAAKDRSQPVLTEESAYLRLLGESIRSARARRGMTRKMLATQSGVSERFLAQLESGTGNASILILRQIARALDLPLDSMLSNGSGAPADLAHTVEFLARLDAADLASARELLVQKFGNKENDGRGERIALIGLRGAGKSTVGRLLADKLQIPFFELDRRIEQASGLSLSMIFDLYGQSGFRRFERRCLDDLLNDQKRFVVAAGGSLASEPATYDRLLSTCNTIWLRATPQEHMARVLAQGDIRPMAQNPEAMSDLERILAEREPLYRQADFIIETSGRTVEQVLDECVERVRRSNGQKVEGSPATHAQELSS
jgi:XRE family transcriptional regulator, aerobic/anaerobic benzoate catabolism transcriptional regulator